jgi:hypothetical protein
MARRLPMTDHDVRYDHKRPKIFDHGDTGYPITINGKPAIFVVDDYVDGKLVEMVSTIRMKRPYSFEEAIIWAAGRAIQRTRLTEGVVRADRTDVN